MTADLDNSVVLRVRNVVKRYSRNPLTSQQRAGRVLFESIFGRRSKLAPKSKDEINVVKGVSFEVRRGEAVGVIGANGAGKTTLLRMLAGHVLPDEGEIEVFGSTGTMIDLTTGIKDTLTGRTNIYLRSAIIGRRRRDVDRDIKEIIDYTELKDAIDAPVATYSAGMRMRLAFATTIFMRPDLLLVDEVLSVGDFRFRQKCLESIRLMRENAGFVLVSHSMGDISRFCDRVIVLENGRAAFDGAPDEAIDFYYDVQEKRGKEAPAKRKNRRVGESIHNTGVIENVRASWRNAAGCEIESVRSGEGVRLRIEFTLATDVRRLIIGVPIYGRDGEFITALSSEQAQASIEAKPGEASVVEVDIPELPMSPGAYHAVLAIVDGPEYIYRQPIDDLIVKSGGLAKYWGSFVLPQSWKSATTIGA